MARHQSSRHVEALPSAPFAWASLCATRWPSSSREARCATRCREPCDHRSRGAHVARLRLATAYVMPLGGKDLSGDSRRSIATSASSRERSRGASTCATRPRSASVATTHSRRPPGSTRSSIPRKSAATSTRIGKPKMTAMTIEDASEGAARGRGPEPRSRSPHRSAPKETRGQRLARPRQAGGHDLDPCGRGREAPVQRQEGRPRRHARSLGFGHLADRLRRGDENRALRHGRPQGLPFHGELGRGDATPTTARARSRQSRLGPTGRVVAPAAAFIGDDQQTPPRFSAIKIDGERAYDLARPARASSSRPGR